MRAEVLGVNSNFITYPIIINWKIAYISLKFSRIVEVIVKEKSKSTIKYLLMSEPPLLHFF